MAAWYRVHVPRLDKLRTPKERNLIITLSFVALILFAIYRKLSDNEGFIPAAIGIPGLVICLIIIIAASFAGRLNCAVGYYRDKAQIAAVIANPNATSEERQNALTLALDDNAMIQQSKLFRSDPFIGWFLQPGVENLEPFVITNIPSANPRATIKIEQ